MIYDLVLHCAQSTELLLHRYTCVIWGLRNNIYIYSVYYKHMCAHTHTHTDTHIYIYIYIYTHTCK